MSLPPNPGGPSSHGHSLPTRTRGDSMMKASLSTKDAVQARLKEISGSLTAKTSPLEVVLEKWDPIDYINDQRLSRDQKIQLGKTLVYCGTEEQAYVTTASEYVAREWPDYGKSVLNGFQRLCDTKQSTKGIVEGCNIEMQIRGEDTQLRVTGDRAAALPIIEVCIFLSMAFRLPLNEKISTYCTPLIKGPGTGVFGHIRVSATHQSLKTVANGLCWLGMVNKPVVAYRYPIPGRPDNLLGVEIAFEVLILLSSVKTAHSIAGRFAMKSHFSALVPTSVTGNCMAWHLRYKLPYVSFEDAFSVEIHSSVQSNYNYNTLKDGYRHIVGWTPTATVVAGDGPAEMYDVGRADAGSAEKAEFRVEGALIGFTGTFDSHFSMTTTALCGVTKRDKSAKLDTAGTTADIHSRAGRKRVLFYSQKDARAWLLDGLSALLHMTKASLLDSTLQEHMVNEATRKQAKALKLPGGSSAVATVADNEKMAILLVDRPDSKVTVGSLVIEHWHRLEALSEAFHAAKFGPKLSTTVTNPSALHLVGFDFFPLARRDTGSLSPKQLTLEGESAATWRDMMYDDDLPSVVIIGRNFGEMITNQAKVDQVRAQVNPAAANCPRTRPVPTGKDFLVMSHRVVRGMSEEWEQVGGNTLRIQQSRHLKIPAIALDKCTCLGRHATSTHCHFVTGIVGKANDLDAGGKAIKEMLSKWPDGAIVVGRTS